MIQKIDYGDINKFLVSIGIILISLSVLIPYFYLKEDFGILLEKEQLEKYEQPIQKIINDKQEQVIKIQKVIPYISIFFAIIGLISSVYGLVRWFKRQSKIDEKFDKELEKLDFELQSMTSEEKEEKTKREVQEIESDEQIEATIINPSIQKDSFLNYMKIEQSVYEVFKNLNSSNFEVYNEQKLGNKFYIDLLLKAKNKKFADRIIEIKYFKNSLPISTIKKAIHQLSTYVTYYKSNMNTNAIVPVLIIVYKEDKINKDKIDLYKSKIIEFSTDIPTMKRLKIEFIEEKNIHKFDARKILLK